jgi:hypothetical protein
VGPSTLGCSAPHRGRERSGSGPGSEPSQASWEAHDCSHGYKPRALSGVAGTGWALGAAMALNVAVAVVMGALCPLLLRRWNIDPALPSGAVTTALADVSGFALTLAL